MMLITLEEHMLPADNVDVVFGGILTPPRHIVDALADVGEGRLKAMDAAGVDVQVLSAVAPGPQQISPAEAVALAHRTDARDES